MFRTMLRLKRLSQSYLCYIYTYIFIHTRNYENTMTAKEKLRRLETIDFLCYSMGYYSNKKKVQTVTELSSH